MNKENSLSKKIEAILFFKGEPLSLKRLAELTKSSEEEVTKAVEELDQNLQDRGIVLQGDGNGNFMLGTSKEASSIIEQIVKDELHRDLGKAGLETLSIIIYLGPVSRSEIDHIRGVNSNFIIRNLLIRGLIERVENEKDKRSFIYRPTFELLGYLGVKSVEELPEYDTLKKELLEKQRKREEVESEKEEE